MLYIQGNKISFMYERNDIYLLDEIDFFINKRTKAGLIGKNGCGKTTLFKIIQNQVGVNQGEIFKRNNLMIGHLSQEIRLDNTIKGLDYLWGIHPNLYQYKRRLNEIDNNEMLVFDINLVNEFNDLGGFDFEIALKKRMKEFSFDEIMLDREIYTYSGGEKTKLALLRLILAKPDILLLDEPTNHLDLQTLLWLEDYLAKIDIPFVVISHDRKFLDKCVSQIWEIEQNKLKVYEGNYSFYKQEKENEKKRLMSEYVQQQRKVKQLKKAIHKRREWALTHQSQTGKNGYAPVYESVTNFSKFSMKKAKNIEHRMEQMLDREEKKKPFIEKERGLIFDVKSYARSKVVLRLSKISKSYDKSIFKEINLSVSNGERLAVVGKNGSGKSTLLKIITGLEKATTGEINFPPSIKWAYYSQDYENLDLQQIILDEVTCKDNLKIPFARTLLGCLGIAKDQVFQKIGTLSMGERSKVALVKVILSDSNFLILDEPTNHFEITAREMLEDALCDYKGTILFVSHDRMFVKKLATRVFDLEHCSFKGT